MSRWMGTADQGRHCGHWVIAGVFLPKSVRVFARLETEPLGVLGLAFCLFPMHPFLVAEPSLRMHAHILFYKRTSFHWRYTSFLLLFTLCACLLCIPGMRWADELTSFLECCKHFFLYLDTRLVFIKHWKILTLMGMACVKMSPTNWLLTVVLWTCAC